MMTYSFRIPSHVVPNVRKPSPELSAVLNSLLKLSCKACGVSYDGVKSQSQEVKYCDARKVFVGLARTVIDEPVPWVRLSEVLNRSRTNSRYTHKVYTDLKQSCECIQGSFDQAYAMASQKDWKVLKYADGKDYSELDVNGHDYPDHGICTSCGSSEVTVLENKDVCHACGFINE